MADENNNLNEPIEVYKTEYSKQITFFNSFDEAEESGLREMAGHTYAQRLENLEIIRKRIYSHLLLPDGTWSPLQKIITIEKGFYT